MAEITDAPVRHAQFWPALKAAHFIHGNQIRGHDEKAKDN
jgi:hypothetical protein